MCIYIPTLFVFLLLPNGESEKNGRITIELYLVQNLETEKSANEQMLLAKGPSLALPNII